MKVRALIIVAVMLAFAGSAWAVPSVDCSVAGVNLVPLNSFTSWGDYRPRDAAVSPAGNVYVTDVVNDTVTIFGRNGNVAKFISVNNPYGITVDNAGKVYVGWAEGSKGHYQGQVDVYDESLNHLGSLGGGWGEFSYPNSIATDDTRVFVADSGSNQVKVYDIQTRELLVSFGGWGSAPGSLVIPSGVAVTSDGTIYVSDFALQLDTSNNTTGMGAGAHIFTIDANNNVTFVSKFASYGYADEGGLFANASGIAVDLQGRVLVSDLMKGNIQFFDASGNYICSHQIEAYTMFPKGMEVSTEGKLVVAANDRVYRYGIDQFTDMAVSPSSLNFNGQICGSTPAVQNIIVANNGEGPVSWTASESVSWLDLSATSGTVAKGASDAIGVSVDPTGLNTGSYTGIIRVTGPGVDEYIYARLTVAGPPSFTAAPASFSFSVVGTEIPASEPLDVSGSGWTSAAPSWITLTPSESQGPLTVASVGVNASALDGMAGGDYSDVITLDTGCSLIPPVDIAVSLSYVKGGSIDVTTNNADATFTVSGPETYTGAGTSFHADGVTEGTYSVSFGPVAGFKAPAAVEITVANGETATANGDYVDLRESNSIILTKAVVSNQDINEVAIHEQDGTLSGSFVVEEPAGAKNSSKVPSTVAAGDFDGDGIDEIAVAHDGGVITGYEADGTPMSGFEFMAYQDVEFVDLASGDYNGDGIDELVVGARPGKNIDAAVRVFGYTGGAVVDTGIYFLASSVRNGVEVASGDLDGDGTDEIVTATVADEHAYFRIWSIDTAAGMGAWNATDIGGFSSVSDMGLDIAVGDMNVDGQAEIVAAYNGKNNATVTVYDTAGNTLVSFTAMGMTEVFVAAGDTDNDGAAEIVISCACERDPGVIVFRSDGTKLTEFNAFVNTDTRGVSVSLGQVVAR